jgi:hypothetical protein
MKNTEGVRKYAAEQGIAEEEGRKVEGVRGEVCRGLRESVAQRLSACARNS